MNKAPGIPMREVPKGNKQLTAPKYQTHKEIKNNRHEFFRKKYIGSQELQILEFSDGEYKVYTYTG